MKKLGIALIAAGMLSAGATSALADGNFYAGASAVYNYLDSERNSAGGDQESFSLGPQIGYYNGENIGIELGYNEDVDGDDIKAYSISLLRKYGDADGIRPYILGGISHFETGLSTSDDTGVDATSFHVGVGLSKMLTSALELRGDIRGFISSEYNDAAASIGINYLFGAEEKAAPPPPPAPEPEAAPEPEVRTITIRLNVEFEFDKAIVRAIYGDELEAIASAMKVHEDIELVLEGHTDSKGNDDYNQKLSDRRAAAVKAKLVEDYGIPGSRISTVGYGESRPIASNDTDEGRARNRRVIGEMSYTEVME